MAKITPTVDEEFRNECPTQTDDEKQILREQILAEGCRDPIDVWNTKLYPILDGHTRFEICNGEGLPFTTRLVDLPDRDAALDWIDRNQMGRRNVTDIQRTVLMGRIYNRRKGSQGGDHRSKSKSGLWSDAAADIAEQHGVSEAAVKRAGDLAEAADELLDKAPELKAAVERGTIPKSNIPGLAKASKARLARLAKLKGPALRKASWTCPHCGGSERDEDGDCAKCREPASSKPRVKEATPADTARAQIKCWYETIGRWLGQAVSIDDVRKIAPGPKGDHVVKMASQFYEALKVWHSSIK